MNINTIQNNTVQYNTQDAKHKTKDTGHKTQDPIQEHITTKASKARETFNKSTANYSKVAEALDNSLSKVNNAAKAFKI